MSRIFEIREQFETFLGQKALVTFHRHSALPDGPNPGEIYERNEALFDKSTLDQLSEEAGKADEDERQRIGELRRGLLFARLDGAVRHVLDAAAERQATTRLKVGGEEIPFLRSEVAIVREKDRSRRAEIARARVDAIADMQDVLQQRVDRLDEASRDLGHEGYGALLQAEAGIDLEALAGEAVELLDRTHDMYREVVSWMLKNRIGIDPGDAEPHDLAHAFGAGEYDAYFPKDKLLPNLLELTRSMEVDATAAGRVRFDLDDRPGKTPWPFVAAERIPERIHFSAGTGEGQRYARGLLRTLGRALHVGYTSPLVPFEGRVFGDRSIGEAWATLFGHLVFDPVWLKRYMGISKAGSYVQFAHAQRLFRMRRNAALLRFELDLYTGQGGSRPADAYHVALSQACLAIIPRETYLYDLTPHLHSAGFLRGDILEAMLYRHLVHYFEEDWFRNPRAGRFLIRLWEPGREGGAERIASMIGSETLALQPLVDDLERYI